jgi:hypothetical protein
MIYKGFDCSRLDRPFFYNKQSNRTNRNGKRKKIVEQEKSPNAS